MQTSNDQDYTFGNSLAAVRQWPVVLFVGVVTIGLGIVVLVWPGETLTVISILIGIQFLLLGLFRLIGAFADTQVPALTGFVGVLLMIAGLIVIRHPFETVAVLATVLGVVWIVGGAIDVIGAFAAGHDGNRLLNVLSGLMSVVAGVIVIAWKAPTVAVIAWIAGFYLVVFGLSTVVSALGMRHLAED